MGTPCSWWTSLGTGVEGAVFTTSTTAANTTIVPVETRMMVLVMVLVMVVVEMVLLMVLLMAMIMMRMTREATRC